MSPAPRPFLVLLVLALLLPAPAAGLQAQGPLDLADARPLLDLPLPAPSDAAPPAPLARDDASRWLLPGRVVVGFDGDAARLTPALATLAGSLGGRVVRVDTRLDFAVVSVPAGDETRLAEAAQGMEGVRYARQDMRATAFFTPDDPRYPEQWGPAAIGLPAAWNLTRGGHDRTVAVLDTGVNASHPDLAPNVCALGPDYIGGDADPADDHGHGTHVAGTVAAAIHNGVGVAGMADACLLPVKVLDAAGDGSFSDVASGIAWAADNGAHVVSMSLGGCPGCDPGAPLSDAVVLAEDAGVLLVAAAGNSGCRPVAYPAAYPSVIAVAALLPSANETAFFSDCGPEVELAAPGADILSTALTQGPLSDPSGYARLSGTSMATPHVAGVAALLWSANLSLTNHQVRCILAQTADDVLDPGRDARSGHGRLDAAEAMLAACAPRAPGPLALSALPGIGAAHLRWTMPESVGSGIEGYHLYRGADPGNLTRVATLARNLSYVDAPLDNGVTYHYRVAGVNAEGEGDLSDLVSVTPRAPVPLPHADDMEDGAGLWTATGLWHLTTDRSRSPGHAWHYGIENAPGPEDNTYDTGGPNAGMLLSPPLDLSTAADPGVAFWHRWDGEGGDYERPLVQVSTDGPEGPWTTVAERPMATGEESASVDLGAYAGRVVHVRFWWDTRDATLNHHEGWYVDDVSFGAYEPPAGACEDVSDRYGNACGAIAYGFEDVRLAGTPLSLGDDEVSEPIPLPFPFTFYGKARESVRVSSNGFLTFGNSTDAGCCQGRPIPETSTPDNLIAAYWADLLPGPASVTYATVGAPGSRAFIVQFTDVPFCCGNSSLLPDANTFQVKLLEGAHAIEVHYRNVSAAGTDRAVSAGIEDCMGADGIQLAYGSPAYREKAFRFDLAEGAPCGSDLPPGTAIFSPAEGAVLSGALAVQGDSSDPEGANVTTLLLVDGVAHSSTAGSGPWTLMLDTAGFADGPHTLEARAHDGAQWGPGHAVGVWFNNTVADAPPEASISAPVNGAMVDGTVVVSGRARDADGDAVHNVTLRVDNATYRANGTADWTYALDTTALPNGWHALAARAHGDVGPGPEHVISILVNNTPPHAPPAVYLWSPREGDVVDGTVRIEGGAHGRSAAVVLVQVRIDGGEWRDAAGTWSWAALWRTREVANGTHLIEARSFDGTAFSDVVAVTVEVANEPRPTVRILHPRPLAPVSGILWVQGDADDDVRVESVEVRVDGGDWRPASGTTSWTRLVDTRQISEGVHDLEARSFDGAEHSRVAFVQFLVANHLPHVVIDTPAPSQEAGGRTLVAGRAFAHEGRVERVEVSVGYGGWWQVANGTDAWSATVDLGGHPTGTWAPIFVRAWDGERHGEPALVQVRVVNQADLALGPGDVEVVRRPIQTDLGDVPNVAAHRRTVRVTVHNDGFVPSGAGVLVLSVETPGVGGALASTRVFADPEVPSIAPGGSLVVEADWDTLGHAGDMRIHAQVIHWDGASERRLDNNRVWTGTFVLVGGLGAGV